MSTIEEARAKLMAVCRTRGVDGGSRIAVRPLSPDEAIGKEACEEFAIKKGKERVIEADFGDHRGQAFTDTPTQFEGTLEDVFALGLHETPNRAVLVASMNAVLASLDMAQGTVHCRNEDPTRCGAEIAEAIESQYGKTRIGLIGLQPAILKALIECFGADNVCVLDLNPDNIGTTKCGITVWDGAADLPKLVKQYQVGLATGSSIVNGTIDEIRRFFDDAGKPLVFFGSTLSGTAALEGLDRLCPFGR